MKRKRKNNANTYTRQVTIENVRGDEDGPVDVSISSETDSVVRWFGREILSHAKGAIDLSRFRQHGAWLFNHDPNQIIGPISNPRIEDGRLVVGLSFDDTEDGRTARERVKNRSLRGASLQYTYGVGDFRDIAEGETVRFHGREIEGPARIVKSWAGIEATLTPVPADSSVGVGRMRSYDP